jgi:hypothetical protein
VQAAVSKDPKFGARGQIQKVPLQSTSRRPLTAHSARLESGAMHVEQVRVRALGAPKLNPLLCQTLPASTARRGPCSRRKRYALNIKFLKEQYQTTERPAINHSGHSGTPLRNRIQKHQPEAAIRNRNQEPNGKDSATWTRKTQGRAQSAQANDEHNTNDEDNTHEPRQQPKVQPSSTTAAAIAALHLPPPRLHRSIAPSIPLPPIPITILKYHASYWRINNPCHLHAIYRPLDAVVFYVGLHPTLALPL